MTDDVAAPERDSALTKVGLWLVDHRVPQAWAWLLIAVAPVLVAIGMLSVTSVKGYSPGIFIDSIAYVEGARWFAAGQGVSTGDYDSLRPITHFPPLFSIALGVGVMSGETAERTAALLHPICLALTLFFLGALVLRLGGSIGAAVAAQWIAALSWDLLYPHFLVLSEPLFMALVFGAIFLLTEHSRRESLPCLIGGAVLLGLATMTRFAGLGIVFGAVIFFVWSSRHRIRDTIIVAMGSALPFVAWLAAHGSGTRAGVDRQVGFIAPALQNVELGARTLGEFLMPLCWPDNKVYLYAAILLGILIAGLVWRKTRILGTIGLGYLAFIVLSLIFVDSGIVLDARMLLPLYPIVIAVLAIVTAVALRSGQDRRTVALIACVLLMFCFDYVNFRREQVDSELPFRVQHGFGYESTDWKSSPVLARIAELPPDVLVISGSPDVVHYLTGRTGVVAPINASGMEDYGVRFIARNLQGRHAVFVDSPRLARQPGTAAAQQMGDWFDLKPAAEERDGKVYWITMKK